MQNIQISQSRKQFKYSNSIFKHSLCTGVVTTTELSPPSRWLATIKPTLPSRCFTVFFPGAVFWKLPLTILHSNDSHINAASFDPTWMHSESATPPALPRASASPLANDMTASILSRITDRLCLQPIQHAVCDNKCISNKDYTKLSTRIVIQSAFDGAIYFTACRWLLSCAVNRRSGVNR